MTAILCLAIGIDAVALALAVRLLRRSRELRAGILAAFAGLAAAGQVALLLAHVGRPLDFDAPSAAVVAGLAAAVAALCTVRAFAATVEELDLAEALHWASMQGVRALTEVAADRGGRLDERLHSLLELGCERFGLEVGLVSCIRGERYEVRALRAPEGFALSAGSALRVDDTICRHTAAGDRPVALERISQAPWVWPAGTSDPLRLEAYLGTPLAVGGQPFGTLVFASRSPAEQRFTASHKDLLALVAQWIAVELERQPASQPDAERPVEARDLASAPWIRLAARRGQTGVDVDAVLRRVERRIRDLVEPRIRLVVEAAAGPNPARDPGVPLDGLLLTLVGHAVEAMQPAGGTLTLSGASLGGAATAYVTLSVSHTGRGPDAEALARAFDPGRADARDGLALARLVRALRRGGGDLSAQVDPVRGTTFTVFLPSLASDASARSAVRALAPPPAAPS